MSDQFFNCVLRGVKTKVKYSRLSKFIPLYGISVETPKGQAATTANYDRKWLAAAQLVGTIYNQNTKDTANVKF